MTEYACQGHELGRSDAPCSRPSNDSPMSIEPYFSQCRTVHTVSKGEQKSAHPEPQLSDGLLCPLHCGLGISCAAQHCRNPGINARLLHCIIIHVAARCARLILLTDVASIQLWNGRMQAAGGNFKLRRVP